MKSRRISLTKEVQKDIAFSINRHITDVRLNWLRMHSKGGGQSHIGYDNDLGNLSGNLLADINSILGIE